MNHRSIVRKLGVAALASAALLFSSSSSFAHCDTMNGPVIVAAQEALKTGDVNLVLIWVQKKDEAEIKEAFNKTLAVRKLSPEAKKLADTYFFETFVRIHRAGEGVAYTGLKPAETTVDPGIEAADKAVESGSAKELVAHLNEAIHNGLHGKLVDVTNKKNFKKDDVAAGREYVQAYVEFIHYAERLFQAASTEAHADNAEPAPAHKH